MGLTWKEVYKDIKSRGGGIVENPECELIYKLRKKGFSIRQRSTLLNWFLDRRVYEIRE